MQLRLPQGVVEGGICVLWHRPGHLPWPRQVKRELYAVLHLSSFAIPERAVTALYFVCHILRQDQFVLRSPDQWL